jgi:hypothetical protein
MTVSRDSLATFLDSAGGGERNTHESEDGKAEELHSGVLLNIKSRL